MKGQMDIFYTMVAFESCPYEFAWLYSICWWLHRSCCSLVTADSVIIGGDISSSMSIVAIIVRQSFTYAYSVKPLIRILVAQLIIDQFWVRLVQILLFFVLSFFIMRHTLFFITTLLHLHHSKHDLLHHCVLVYLLFHLVPWSGCTTANAWPIIPCTRDHWDHVLVQIRLDCLLHHVSVDCSHTPTD